MATNYNKRKKNLLALFLSLMMATTAVGLAACDEETTNSSSSSPTDTTTTETDSSHINNGSFEFTAEKATNLIATSATGWSIAKNTSADKSDTASGVIDVSQTAWDNLTKTKLTSAAPTTKEGAAAVWDTMSAYDKLQFYKVWEAGDHDDDVDDLEFYNKETDKFNVDADDIPT